MKPQQKQAIDQPGARFERFIAPHLLSLSFDILRKPEGEEGKEMKEEVAGLWHAQLRMWNGRKVALWGQDESWKAALAVKRLLIGCGEGEVVMRYDDRSFHAFRKATAFEKATALAAEERWKARYQE